ncbi:ABC transporter permease, partial [Psychromonas aquatilis]
WLPLGSASLGEMISHGKDNLQAHWLAITAFISLSSILVLFVFIGEAAGDAFDPRIVL